MAKDSHTQCLLSKGKTSQVSWIPSDFATKGKYVKLRRRGDESWDDGWLVVETWTTMDSEEVNDNSQDYKRQRLASDRPRDSKRKKLKVR